jgi:hypothetical protein
MVPFGRGHHHGAVWTRILLRLLAHATETMKVEKKGSRHGGSSKQDAAARVQPLPPRSFAMIVVPVA